MSGCIKFTFSDVDFFSATEEGVYLFGTNATVHTFTNVKVDRNGYHGMRLDNRAGHDVIVQGGVFELNSDASSGTYSDIRVENTAAGYIGLQNVDFDETNAVNPARKTLYHVDFGGTTPRVIIGSGVRGPSNTLSSNQITQIIQNSTQRVGIGTTSPSDALHVLNGAVRVESTNPAVNLWESDAAAGSRLWRVDTDSGEFRVRVLNDSFSGARALTGTRTGNVFNSWFFGGLSDGTGVSLRAGSDATWVNRVAVSGGATGGSVSVAAEGSDTDVSLRVDGKGAGVVILRTQPSSTPPSNGDLVFERTSNTSLTIRLRGTDGVVRSVALTLT
jgi:hypothetical protein